MCVGLFIARTICTQHYFASMKLSAGGKNFAFLCETHLSPTAIIAIRFISATKEKYCRRSMKDMKRSNDRSKTDLPPGQPKNVKPYPITRNWQIPLWLDIHESEQKELERATCIPQAKRSAQMVLQDELNFRT